MASVLPVATVARSFSMASLTGALSSSVTKNHAETLIFQSEKTLGEIGDKVSDDDKAPVKEAIEKLRNTVATGDTDAIKADSEALEKAFMALSEKLYAQQGGAQGAGPDMGDMGGAQGGQGFYNADFEDKSNQ